MEQYTKEEIESAKTLLELYISLVENNNSAVKFYLAENVVLDWFGKTIESKKVFQFIKDQIGQVRHHFPKASPSEKVAFKENHYVKVPKQKEETLLFPVNKDLVTPPKQNEPSTSMIEMGQGDGLHNCPIVSPPKKMKFTPEEDTETVESESETTQLRYLTAEGTVEFHRPSVKKLQTETRWKRPAKLHIGYIPSSYKDCTIYLIIYEANLKCRRNLYKELCDSDTKTSV